MPREAVALKPPVLPSANRPDLNLFSSVQQVVAAARRYRLRQIALSERLKLASLSPSDAEFLTSWRQW